MALGAVSATDLTIGENFTNPIGFYDAEPVFSWKLPIGTKKQSAYQVIVQDATTGKEQWNSGKTVSDQSAWVPFAGVPFSSRQQVSWKIKFWDGDGVESDWSDRAQIEMGLLSNNDWSAAWIEASKTESNFVAHPGYYFRKDFKAEKTVVQARLYVSALGICEFEINGERVGDHFLTPGWTSYENRIETLTYDVTAMLREGDNTIGALLGEGWYAGTLVTRHISKLNGLKPKLLGQLELTYSDGSTARVVTDGTWKVTEEGPITAAGLYYGVDYDARLELGKWSQPAYNDSKWSSAVATEIAPKPRLEPKPMRPVRVMQVLQAQSVKALKPGVFLFDFGQNLVGFPELNIPVTQGAEIKVRVAEMLNQDGTPYTENYRAARSNAFYIAAKDGTVNWAPDLTFFGFRYLELSGFPADVKLNSDAAVAKVIHSAFESSGIFTSSHTKLNQLQSNIRWGQIGNFVDIPTDCPQRNERLGWTGDAQVILESSFFNYDLYAFWSRWLQTVRDDQGADGKVPHVVPSILGKGSPGWADVIVTAPWQLYVRTGDIRILEDNYEAMKKWVGVYERDAENFITDLKGFGDWLQPYAKDGNRGETPMNLIATAYFGRVTQIMAQAAEALGKPDDALRYRQIHANIRTAFSKQFFDAEGKLSVVDTQTGYLMALSYGLLEPELIERAQANLIVAFKNADRHLRTGFLGTPLIAPTFDAIGHPEIAYELLLKETYPGWLNKAATRRFLKLVF